VGVTVVEAAGVPHPVIAAAASVEIASVGAVKHVDAVVGIFAGVAVHDVHQHQQAQPVGFVNHRLQLVRCPKPAACLHADMISIQEVCVSGTWASIILPLLASLTTSFLACIEVGFCPKELKREWDCGKSTRASSR
jgi:hypothetical protein